MFLNQKILLELLTWLIFFVSKKFAHLKKILMDLKKGICTFKKELHFAIV